MFNNPAALGFFFDHPRTKSDSLRGEVCVTKTMSGMSGLSAPAVCVCALSTSGALFTCQPVPKLREEHELRLPGAPATDRDDRPMVVDRGDSDHWLFSFGVWDRSQRCRQRLRHVRGVEGAHTQASTAVFFLVLRPLWLEVSAAEVGAAVGAP